MFCAIKKEQRKNERTTQHDTSVVSPVSAGPRRRLTLNLGISPQARYALAQQSNQRADNLTEEDLREIDEKEAENEFTLAFHEWQEWVPDWKTLYPYHKFETFDLIDEMLNLDMRVLMKEVEQVSALYNNKFKLLPIIANASKFQLGALVS